MENKTIIGILAIIFGLLIMIFPFAGQIALSVIVGIGILILSIYLFILGVESWSSSKTASIAYIILGILLLLFGILMLGNVFIFDYTVIIYLYIVGFILLIMGIIGLFSRSVVITRGSAALTTILGILCVILASIAVEMPVYGVSIILGISLVVEGLAVALGEYGSLDNI